MKLFFFLFLFSLYGRYFISFKSNYNLSDFDFNLMATLVKKFSKAVITAEPTGKASFITAACRKG